MARDVEWSMLGDPTEPEWNTAEMVQCTVAVWQPYYAEPLTKEDTVKILANVGQIYLVLASDNVVERNRKQYAPQHSAK